VADENTRKRLAEELQARLAMVQPYRLLGQADVPYARRTNIHGVIAAPVMVFWNIEKR
jgi:peptide/nickel transport system substrate-binding protein